MNKSIDPRVEKLPAWARTLIADLSRQRDVAVRKLTEAVDTDTPSPVYVDDFVYLTSGSPTRVRRYIQTRSVTIDHQGVILQVYAGSDRDGIRLMWGADMAADVAFVPRASGYAELIHARYLRTGTLKREKTT